MCYEPAESNKMKRMGGNSNWLRAGVDAGELPARRVAAEVPSRCSAPAFTVSSTRPDPAIAGRSPRSPTIWRRAWSSIFLRDPSTGRRPVIGGVNLFQTDEQWKDYLLFYEYFHGGDRDDRYAGTGLGSKSPDRMDRARRQSHPGTRRQAARGRVGRPGGLTGDPRRRGPCPRKAARHIGEVGSGKPTGGNTGRAPRADRRCRALSKRGGAKSTGSRLTLNLLRQKRAETLLDAPPQHRPRDAGSRHERHA